MGPTSAHLRVCRAAASLSSLSHQGLRRARKTGVSSLPTPRSLLLENPYVTPRTLANHLIHHSSILTELVITREWLQDTAHTPQTVESATAYWNFTRLGLLHAQRSG